MNNQNSPLKLVLILLGISIWPLSPPAEASVIFDSDGRYISGTASAQQEFGNPLVDDDFLIFPSASFAVFDESDTASVIGPNASAVASADQTSSLTPMLFSAQGSSSVNTNSGSTSQAAGSSHSEFIIDFSLTEAYVVSLSGNLTGSGSSVISTDGSSGTAGVTLTDLAGSVTILFSVSAGSITLNETTLFNHELLLSPGNYRITAGSSANAHLLSDITSSGSGSYALAFAFAPVSEPASLALLGLGIAGISFQRRKKQ